MSVASGGGSIADTGNGTWTYTPAANYNGPVSFNYTVSDGLLSASSTASLIFHSATMCVVMLALFDQAAATPPPTPLPRRSWPVSPTSMARRCRSRR